MGRRLALAVAIVLLSLVGSAGHGTPVSVGDARRAAVNWLAMDSRPLGADLRGTVRDVRTFSHSEGSPLYYVVSLSPSGYVILSADDLVEPIIAFSSDGDYEPVPENPMYDLVVNDLSGRTHRLRSWQGGPTHTPGGEDLRANQKWTQLLAGTERSLQGTTSVSDPRVAPLVQTRWNQGTECGVACYNYYTPPGPVGSASNYVCGCVATAMAQLMRYWKYPTSPVATTCYGISRCSIADGCRYPRGGDGSGGNYDWANMPEDPDCPSLPERQAIGALCYDAGISAHMNYCNLSEGGSSATAESAALGLRSVFRYSEAHWGWNSGYDLPDEARDRMINANLHADCPVILGISGSGGHAIVCDGYGYNLSPTMYHHLNLGWAGSQDAWYSLPTVDPPGDPYTRVTACVYNIFKSGTGEIIAGRVTDSGGNPLSGVMVSTDSGSTDTTDTRGVYALRVPSLTSHIVTPQKSGYTFVPPSMWVATDFSTDNTSICGNQWPVDFIACASPTPPTGASAEPSLICEGQISTLTVAGGSGTTCKWYRESCEGALIGTGPTITVSPMSTTTYYVRWETAGCGNSTCATTSVTVNANPGAPTSATATPVRVCNGSTSTLTAFGGCGDTLHWSTSCYGPVIAVSSQISVSPEVTTTYYCWWQTGDRPSGWARVTVPVACDQFSDAAAGLEGLHNCSLAWGDCDSDGDLDIAIAGRTVAYERVSRIYRNEGGAFSDIDAGLAGVEHGSLAWGDYDNDGDLDLVLAGSGLARVYRNDSGAFVDSGAILPGLDRCSVAWGDYDNDGDLDLALGGSDMVRIYRNDQGVFADSGVALSGVSRCSVAWGDCDNDGDLDLAIAGYYAGSGEASRIYRNDAGVFADIGAGLEGVYDCSLAWGDYDNDGDPDLALAGLHSGSAITKVCRNDNGTFVDSGIALPGVDRCSLAWGDSDNDGDLDLALSGFGIARVYRNEGDAFVDTGSKLTAADDCSAAWGDYDADGDLDLAIAGLGFSSIYRNEPTKLNTNPDVPTALEPEVTPGGVILRWTRPDDSETPGSGLSFNIRVGSSQGAGDIVSGMASPSTGLRRIPAAGYARKQLSWPLNGLSSGTYFWSVQAVDTSFAASAWAEERTATVEPDRTDPVVQISIPGAEEVYTTRSIVLDIGGTASDNVLVKRVIWANDRGGGGTCKGATSWSATGIALQPGRNMITVTALDADGNGGRDAVVVDRDATGPSVTITFPTTEPTCRRNTFALKLEGTAQGPSEVARVICSVNGGAPVACSGTSSWSTATTHVDGSSGGYRVVVSAEDVLGNVGTDTLDVEYVRTEPGSTWQGMAMVSLPVIPDLRDPKTVVGFEGIRWWLYDSNKQSYVAYPKEATWFEPRESTPGRGFWATLPATNSVYLYGNIPDQDQPVKIRLMPGWNLFGQPFVSPVTWSLSGIMVQQPGAPARSLGSSGNLVANCTWSWNGTEGKYDKICDRSVVPDAVGVIEPWRAYWIRAYHVCDLILPAPQ